MHGTPKAQPYWWDEVPRPTLPEAPLPAEADVVVVGSGYTGLSCALTLARAGRSVQVLEAEEPGFGASSRNGGGCGGAPFKLSFSTMRTLFGHDQAVRIFGEGPASLNYMEQLIRTEQIDCAFVRSGRFNGAYRPGDYDVLARENELLNKHLGFEMRMVPKDRQDTEIGSDFYHGGRLNPTDGVVHPARYHRGLLERVLNAGAAVAGKTPALQIERDGAAFRVTTPRGTIRAGRVALGTNGYTRGVVPWLARRVIPVSSAIIATEELPPETVRRLIPRGNMLIDTKRTVHYYRTNPEGTRILMGGRPLLREAPPEKHAPHLYRFLTKVFPELDGVAISHAWAGRLGFTFDKLPHIGARDGMHYACGYLGSGVAMSTYLGHKMGLQIAGDPAGETALDDRLFPTIPLYGGNPWFLTAVATYYRLRDAIG